VLLATSLQLESSKAPVNQLAGKLLPVELEEAKAFHPVEVSEKKFQFAVGPVHSSWSPLI
jgi:hypothetical protein